MTGFFRQLAELQRAGIYRRGSDIRRIVVMSAAYAAHPFFRMKSMSAGRFELKIIPKTLEMMLWNFRHARGSANSRQSAQVAYPAACTQLRVLHHVAFAFSRQPGHFSSRYLPHAPQ